MSAGLILAVSILLPVSFAGALDAQGRSQGRGRSGSGGGGTDVAVSAVVVFGDNDRATFRNYFVTHRITAEPLPPGIAKNVARGKPLPPGIAKKALPAGLLVLAPRVDKGISFAIVGDVVVAHRGGVVVDLMVGVFR